MEGARVYGTPLVTKIEDSRDHIQNTQCHVERFPTTKKTNNKKQTNKKQQKEGMYFLALALTLTFTLNHSSTSHFGGPVHLNLSNM